MNKRSRNQALQHKYHQRHKHKGFCKILVNILVRDKGKTQIDGPEDKKPNQRDDIDRLYVPRKEGRRGFVSIEDSVNASI